jgi:hypothetical protein
LTVTNPDSDGDGMPDDWEQAHGLMVGVNDADGDPDGDHMTNLAEYEAGTDPQDNKSYLKIDSIIPPGAPAGTVTLSFGVVPGKSYTVQFSDVLPAVSWTDLTNVTASAGNQVITVWDPLTPPSPRRYYRLRIP